MRRSSVGSLAEERLESTRTLIPSALYNLGKVKVKYPDTAVKYENVLLRIQNDYFDVRQMSLGLNTPASPSKHFCSVLRFYRLLKWLTTKSSCFVRAF